MTVRVNLLPHREERRKRARQHFFVLAGGTAVIGLLLVGAMHTFYQRQIDVQTDRNAFLKAHLKTCYYYAEFIRFSNHRRGQW